MPRLLVDTDVMVDYLRGQAQAAAFVKKHTGRIALSAVVVAELYAGVKGQAEQTMLDELVSVFEVLPVGLDTAKTAGLLKRDFGKSHGLGLADAIIAATAQAQDAQLATLNAKHFPMLPGLKPAYVKNS